MNNNKQQQQNQLDEAVKDLESDVEMEAAANFGGAGDQDPIHNSTQNQQVEIQNSFLWVLENDLVADKLLFFLNLEDMKALSAVSLSCCSVVRNNEEFKKRAVFIISEYSLAAQVVYKSSYPWRHFIIQIPMPDFVPGEITSLLKSAKFLCLWLPNDEDAHCLQMINNLTEILSSTIHLESLEMDISMFKNHLTNLFSDSVVQARLANLKVLSVRNMLKEICFIENLRYRDDFRFAENFRQLAKLAFRLTKFALGKVELVGKVNDDNILVKYIPKMVNASKDTLEDLELHWKVWKLDEMNEIRCPKLKRLVLSADNLDKDIVEAFLRNQPPLEELDIEIDGQFPLTTLQAIQERVTEMKKFHIYAENIGTSKPVNWSFLETMDKLKDFRIGRPRSSNNTSTSYYGSGVEIIAKLRDTVEKVSVGDFNIFWKDPPAPFAVPTHNIGELLGRFVNLTEIDLFRSKNAVTDLGLQSVITNCKKLTFLVFSHCDQLTDFGISGVQRSEDGKSEEKVGVSLKDLKGLEQIQICCCPLVSPECLLKVVELDFLRYFGYDGNVPEPKAFVAQIVRQNPCLEKVDIPVTNKRLYDVIYLWEMKDEMKQRSPRVRIVDIPLHCDWQDNNSESDAISLSEDDDGDDVDLNDD